MPSPTSPCRVLVVDDDETCRFLLRRIFEREAGFEVEEAATDEEALRILADTGHEFDLILSDLRLNCAQDGVDVLEAALRQRPRAIRVLMSGSLDVGAAEAAKRRARAHEVVEKPMTTEEFGSLIAGLVIAHGLGDGSTMTRSRSKTGALGS